MYNENSDQRRRLPLKRKLKSLEEDRNLLLQLVDALRDSSDRHAQALLNLVRSNAPLEEIRNYVEGQGQEGQMPELIKLHEEVMQSSETGPKMRRKAFSAKPLADQPPIRVPAKPWTTVTDDDDFISHLISLFFTWIYPCFPWIDRELFIRDMKSGNVDSQFCSPFLVNTLLAEACVSKRIN